MEWCIRLTIDNKFHKRHGVTQISGELTEIATRGIQEGSDGARILTQRVFILQIVHVPKWSKGQRLVRQNSKANVPHTQSKPEAHLAILNRARTGEAKMAVSGMSVERNMGVR